MGQDLLTSVAQMSVYSSTCSIIIILLVLLIYFNTFAIDAEEFKCLEVSNLALWTLKLDKIVSNPLQKLQIQQENLCISTLKLKMYQEIVLRLVAVKQRNSSSLSESTLNVTRSHLTTISSQCW